MMLYEIVFKEPHPFYTFVAHRIIWDEYTVEVTGYWRNVVNPNKKEMQELIIPFSSINHIKKKTSEIEYKEVKK